MSDNTLLNAGTGGDTARTKDRAGIKTSIVALDLTPGGGSETLMNGSIPITDNSGSLTVDAPVGTPVFARLSDGTTALTTSSGRLAVDASGVAVPITDNSGSLTVDGTVTANTTGTVRHVIITPTISTSPAYTSGDALGGLQTIASAVGTSGGAFEIETVALLDLDKLDAAIDIVFFDRTFTASTDNAVFDPSDGDAANILGAISIAAGHYFDFNDWSLASRSGLLLAGKLNSGTSLFAQALVRGTPTYATTTSLTFKYTIREV